MKKESVKWIVCLSMAAVMVVTMLYGTGGCEEQKPTPAGPTLYERLGGLDNIAVVIDDVIERSYVDEVFSANPLIAAAHHRYPKAAYKYNATALACMVMGGPQKYTGRSLKEAHKHLKVTEVEWQALLKIFRDSMNSFKVPQKEQDEIIAIIESTKGDIISAEKTAKR